METKRQIEDIVRQLSPFDKMDHKVVQRLLHNKTRILSMQPKQYLFQQGVSDNNTFYLLKGSLIIDKSGIKTRVKSGTVITRSPLFPGNPRPCSAMSEQKCIILAINNNILQELRQKRKQIVTRQISPVEKINDIPAENNNNPHWMSLVLSSKAFMKLPPVNVQALLMRLEERKYKAGDFVLKQGEKSQYFYMVHTGQCQVMRCSDGKKYTLATLRAGHSFGEEELLTGSSHNANIVMVTNGSVMRLNKEDFNRLLRDHALKLIKKKEADSMVMEYNAQWLDVRSENEYKQGHIAGSINIPWFMLRLKADTLDPELKYILYCDTGRHSAAGTFILRQNGNLNVYCLQDHWEPAGSYCRWEKDAGVYPETNVEDKNLYKKTKYVIDFTQNIKVETEMGVDLIHQIVNLIKQNPAGDKGNGRILISSVEETDHARSDENEE